ncbi:hypothetical protein CYMTET_32136 [Cymbomonas tetramitiformis]|uniref:Acyl-CoA dehydrogenase/oxidase C-terminal domain-containing protein n=1 Tax=Cymbomonas tetramitiformis TaxID=36881 RepID=A0AAE0FFS3_9CHLO|nr:hypothetical protein CYMTET_32136 [Cymbomonas tetramitiformis]
MVYSIFTDLGYPSSKPVGKLRAFLLGLRQGLTAEYMVVIADLIVDGTSHGPHPFVCKMRVGGELIPGIQVGDMGVKTIANDLDNAWLRFTRVWMPKESLLAKYADIIDNKYVQVGKEKMRIEVIGQRLLTGRLVIAQACIFSIQDVFKKAKAYTSEKQCHVPGSELPLCELPQVKHLFREADAELQHMEQYLTQVQQRLAVHLSAGTIPPDSLVESIAVAKVKAIEVATNMSFRLSQEVGSYALMGSTGFEHQAMLLCCKFAEGDSRILLQKMARDRLKDFQNQSWFSMLADMFDADSRRELLLCASLGRALTSGPAVEVWNEQYEKVYGLAEMVCERHLKMHQSKL